MTRECEEKREGKKEENKKKKKKDLQAGAELS